MTTALPAWSAKSNPSLTYKYDRTTYHVTCMSAVKLMNDLLGYKKGYFLHRVKPENVTRLLNFKK